MQVSKCLLLFAAMAIPCSPAMAAGKVRGEGIDGGTVYTLEGSSMGFGPLETPFLSAAIAGKPASSGNIQMPRLNGNDPDRTANGTIYEIKECDGFRVAMAGGTKTDVCSALKSYGPAGGDVVRVAKFNSRPLFGAAGGGSVFYQSGRDWLQLGFVQKFTTENGFVVSLLASSKGNDTIHRDGSVDLYLPFLAPELTPETAGQMWMFGNGGVVQYTDDKRILLPPGYAMTAASGLCIRVGKVMENSDLVRFTAKPVSALTEEQIIKSRQTNGCGTEDGVGSKKSSAGAVIVLLAIVAIVIGIPTWLFSRFRRKRRPTSPEA